MRTAEPLQVRTGASLSRVV